MWQVFFFEPKSDEVGFGGREPADPLSQSQNGKNCRIHAQTHGRVSTLDAQKRWAADLGTLSDHGGCEPTAASCVLEVLPEICECAAYTEWQEWRCPGHGSMLHIFNVEVNNGRDILH